jgi:hypothetical protein
LVKITVENDVHPKFPKKQFIVKNNNFKNKKKVGEDRPSESSQSLPFLEENMSVVL